MNSPRYTTELNSKGNKMQHKPITIGLIAMEVITILLWIPMLIIVFHQSSTGPAYEQVAHGVSVVATLIIGVFVCLVAILGIIAAFLNQIKWLLVSSAVLIVLGALATAGGGILIFLAGGLVSLGLLFFLICFVLVLAFIATVYLAHQAFKSSKNQMASKNSGYVIHPPSPNPSYAMQQVSPPPNSNYTMQGRPTPNTNYVMQGRPTPNTNYVMQGQPAPNANYVMQGQPAPNANYVMQGQPASNANYTVHSPLPPNANRI
jgi:hypothetical protein